MSNAIYTERLTTYIRELSLETKNELFVKLALLIFAGGHAETLSRLSAFYYAVRQLMAPFHPDEHLSFNRAGLTMALGECVAEWFGQPLRRPLTGRELDQLFFSELPTSGVPEALQRLGIKWAEHKEPTR